MCSWAVKWEGEDDYFEWNTDTQYENETFLCKVARGERIT